MADLTGGELVARVLKQAGVGHVFTLCGGHIAPIYDGCLQDGIDIIDTRHEQAAAHAADAWARLTRDVGVAIVTAGPGVTDAVTGVANATPRAVAAGRARRRRRAAACAGSGALQEMEQVALLRPITKGAWSVTETRRIPEVLDDRDPRRQLGRAGPGLRRAAVRPAAHRAGRGPTRADPADYVHRRRSAGDPPAIERLRGAAGRRRAGPW